MLVGPTAQRLWQVDQRLLTLDGERSLLLIERAELLRRLQPGTAERQAAVAPAEPAFRLPEPLSHRETSPRQVQSTLLGLGALLLAGAGVVFAAVTYGALGVGGRVLVLLCLTAAAAFAPVRLRSRGLTDSAEAVGAVALVLCLLDAWALRRAGIGDAVDSRTYWAGTTAVLAAATAGYDALVPLRSARNAAVLLAQLPVILLLARSQPSMAVSGLVLCGLAGADLLLVSTLCRPPGFSARPGMRLALALGGAWLLLATGLSAIALAEGHDPGASGLITVAGILAAGSVPLVGTRLRSLVTGPIVPLVTGAAFGLTHGPLSGPIVLLAVALVGLSATGLLPRSRRDGPVLGGLLVAGLSVASEAEAVGQSVLAPLGWLAAPWTAGTTGSARSLVGPDTAWSGTIGALAVLLGAGAAALIAGWALGRLRSAFVPAAVLLGLGTLVLPLAVGASYTAALGLLVLSAAAGVGGAARVSDRTVAAGLLTGASAAMALVLVWSLADRDATLVVVACGAALAAVVAVRLPAAAAIAALLLGAELVAGCAAVGLSADHSGAALLPLVALVLVTSAAVRRLPLEAAAVVLAAVGTGLASSDVGWLSWTLATDGLLALAISLRPDRRNLAACGAILLSASSWVRLADAHVTAPEPYVLPLAAVALLLGHLRRRSQPGVGSFAAYGSGLSLLLVPSLLAALTDGDPLRGVLLLPAAALVVVAGVSERLRAPLTIGSAVLVLDALHLLAPYAAALPRWSLLALVGTVLVVLGATYEQRRRDLDVLRERYDALT